MNLSNVYITSSNGALKFTPFSGATLPNHTTSPLDNLQVSLNSAGEGKFYITGTTQSTTVGDTQVVMRKASPTGEVVHAQPATVFWFDVKTYISCTDSSVEVLPYASTVRMRPKGQVKVRAQAQVVPRGVSNAVPQVSGWVLGAVQNVTTSWRGDVAQDPYCQDPLLVSTESLKVYREWNHEVVKLTNMLDVVCTGTEPPVRLYPNCPLVKGYIDPELPKIHFSDTRSAVYEFQDQPGQKFAMLRDGELVYRMSRAEPVTGSSPPRNHTVLWSLGHKMEDRFRVWACLWNSDNPHEVIPLQQRDWHYLATCIPSGITYPATRIFGSGPPRQPDNIPNIQGVPANVSGYDQTVRNTDVDTNAMMSPLGARDTVPAF
jgi:hypothetical protein